MGTSSFTLVNSSKMAENVNSLGSSETGASSGLNSSSVVAPPKFVFGQNSTSRAKRQSPANNGDNEESASSDTEEPLYSSNAKRPVDSEEEKQKSNSDQEGCLSPVKKMARLQKDSQGSCVENQDNRFKLKPSMLSEVAKNLASVSSKGENQTVSSLAPKTIGTATAESASTDNKREEGMERADGDAAGALANTTSNFFQQFMQSGNKSPSGSSSGGFVFGQNMGARVLFTASGDNQKTDNTEKQEGCSEDAEVAGLSLCREDPKSLAEVAESCSGLSGPTSPTNEKEHHSLAEAAQAYQETVSPSHSQAQLDYVDVVNGEEEERNVLQVNCRLFVFDTPNHSWREKGRGTLRLNDMCQSMSEGIFQSRLVMRTRGSLRVVLNTKLWPQMTMERANEKSLRITAFDCDNDIKIFLVMAAPKEIQQLWTAIDRRIQALKRSQETLERSDSPKSEPSADGDSRQEHTPNKTDTKSEEAGSKPDSAQLPSRTTVDEDSNDSCEPEKVSGKRASSDEE